MATRTLHGKCPRCCPNGGACFERIYDPPGKKCNNCHAVYPRKGVNGKPGKPNKTQEEVIARLLAEFGGEITEKRMIGRKVWVAMKNETRNWMLGDSFYGTIGPCGAFSLKFHTCMSTKELKDWHDVKAWFYTSPKKEVTNV